jgi:polar amino acid transport system substrate-binding protein
MPDMLLNSKDSKKRHGAITVSYLVKAIVIAVTVAWAGLQAPVKAYGDEVLRIATDVWLPYENISDERSPGFSTEVIARVLREMGVQSETREFPWARAVKDVFGGKRDALYSAFWTEERALYCYYPEESLMREKWVFYVRSADIDELSFSSYDELKDRRIGVLRGASVTEEFWEFVKENANYEEAKTDELNFKKLDRGRIDYVVTSYSNGAMLVKNMGLTDKVQSLPKPIIKEDNLYIIFSKKTMTPKFVGQFSTALGAFKKTNSYQAIYEKYFGPTYQ